jgi:hypothetical protein
MNEVLEILSDAMFCHLFKKILPTNEISAYLFDNDFDHGNIKNREKNDYVKLLDAFAQRKQSKSYILDVKRVNNAIFHRNFGDADHPFMTLMCFALREKMSPQESSGPFDDVDIPTTTHVLFPPSKLNLELIDITDNLQPGVVPDTTLMTHLAKITMIDWKHDERLKDVPNLPKGAEWECLEELVGEGKRFAYFHSTRLLPYLMNFKKSKDSDCKLTNAYKSYPPASWRYACMGANGCNNINNKEGRESLCSNVIYILLKHTFTLQMILMR